MSDGPCVVSVGMPQPQRNDWPQGDECLNGGASPRLRLTREQRRALELLASDPQGVSEVFMFAHWISFALLAGLVRAGFATAQREAGSRTKTTKVERYRITDAGQRALEG